MHALETEISSDVISIFIKFSAIKFTLKYILEFRKTSYIYM